MEEVVHEADERGRLVEGAEAMDRPGRVDDPPPGLIASPRRVTAVS